MTDIELKTSKILASIDQGVGWLTFNQHEKRNAVSLEMWQGIGDELEIFDGDGTDTAILHDIKINYRNY